ncbi:hypothetical protein REPUB_Repub06bG0164500 [Reevesia pubescens]
MFLKFNVNGLVIGKPSPAGIVKVFRSNDGEMLLVFSKSVRKTDSNVVEFLTIKEAFSIFATFKWSLTVGLIIKSDSINVVKWFNCEDSIL